jgi:acetylornithine deacetylase/succinyl-diaminopimelate desuccinylase-like protein
MTRDSVIAQTQSYFDSGLFETEIGHLVSIKSQSQIKEGLPECLLYLTDAMVPAFEKMGFSTKIFKNPVDGGGPVLLATRIEDPNLQTVLGYGHGDVVLGFDQSWTKGDGPWKTSRDGDRLYGRGTADNKGQHLINMSALGAVISTRGKLGFNSKFIIETGEENGSRGLREIIESDLEAFSADVFIASDGPRVRHDWPTVSLGARGGLNFDLTCTLREGGHHSGNWGGALPDPAIILANAISCIVNKTGQIQIKEWLPAAITSATKELLKDIKLDGGPSGPIPVDMWGDPDLSSAENVFAWNSFTVLAMSSGNPEKPVNAISPTAKAHCQLRYIFGTDINNVLPSLRLHLDANGFDNISILEPPEENRGGFMASRTEPSNIWSFVVRESIKQTTGIQPAVIPQMGGSICNDLFTDLLGLPAIWIPHSYSGCSQHAPDEHILLPLCRNALGIMGGLYWDIGEEKNEK